MTPAEKENRDLRAANARLTEALEDARVEVRELKARLGAEVAAEEFARLRLAFRANPGSIYLLCRLFSARGRVVSHQALIESLPGDPDERTTKILTVYICRLRDALGREAIKNVLGVGYALTAAGIAKCDAALCRDLAA